MKIKDNRFVRGLFFLLNLLFPPSKNKYGGMGKQVILTPPISIGNPHNVFLGDHIGIGSNAFISAINAKFVVKGNCAIAENLTVHTGNHVRLVGKFITDINENNKPKGYDSDIIVEKDVWIGCNVTLLSGVTIGRGSTIAAGAVVCKDIPPYCIAGGCPARVIKFYWSIEQILEHESKLYKDNERYSKEQLEAIFKRYQVTDK